MMTSAELVQEAHSIKLGLEKMLERILNMTSVDLPESARDRLAAALGDIDVLIQRISNVVEGDEEYEIDGEETEI